jgi:hypothetical protein
MGEVLERGASTKPSRGHQPPAALLELLGGSITPSRILLPE